jgi:hypothetical protein
LIQSDAVTTQEMGIKVAERVNFEMDGFKYRYSIIPWKA